MNEHTHECRECGGSIWCDGSHDFGRGECWEGGNVGCENERAENAAIMEDAR